MQPIISIIIPTYNRPQFVIQSIKSVLNQSYINFELIILDDSDNDSTTRVVEKISDCRIKYHKNPETLGFINNWSLGVSIAKGRYISILGDDDFYEPDFLSSRVKMFLTNPELIAVTGSFICCDSKNQFIRKSRSPCHKEVYFKNENLVNFCFGTDGEWFNGATLYKTDIYKKTWQEIKFSDTAIDLAMHISIATTPNATVGYILNEAQMQLRVHEGQTSVLHGFNLSKNLTLFCIDFTLNKILTKSPKIEKEVKFQFSKIVNSFGRRLYDNKLYIQSCKVFLFEVIYLRSSFITWARIIRSILLYFYRQRRMDLNH